MLRLLLMITWIDSTCSFILSAWSMCNYVVGNGVAFWILASTAVTAAAATTTAAAAAAAAAAIVLLWDSSNSS